MASLENSNIHSLVLLNRFIVFSEHPNKWQEAADSLVP